MGNQNPDSIWLYNPNFPLAIVGAVLYAIPMVIQFYQTVLKHKSYYFLPVLIGACLEVGGYIARAVSIKQETEIPPYAVSSSLIILAPLFIGAGNYLLLSRLCLAVLPPQNTHIFHIPTAHLTRIFVTCDILTFLIQASGSGIASSGNWKGNTVKIGTDVLIVGLAVQVATFALFIGIVGQFHVLTGEGVREDAGNGWEKVLKAIYVSSGLIIIRCIYRLIEFALGIFGYPFTHEWLFYVFETLPMLPAILIFCIWHPAENFGSGRKGQRKGSNIPLDSGDAVPV